jgi:hypothetical protein
MNKEDMKALAIAHWKEHYPDCYNAMKEQGFLEKEALEAADITTENMIKLIKKGLDEKVAWEKSSQLFLFYQPSICIFFAESDPIWHPVK